MASSLTHLSSHLCLFARICWKFLNKWHNTTEIYSIWRYILRYSHRFLSFIYRKPVIIWAQYEMVELLAVVMEQTVFNKYIYRFLLTVVLSVPTIQFHKKRENSPYDVFLRAYRTYFNFRIYKYTPIVLTLLKNATYTVLLLYF